MATYRVGDVLAGGYRVIDVKRGGMGVVYISHQPPDRFYAVKTVDPATASTSDPEAIEQFFKYFRDEVDLWIRVSRQARHENIVEALLYNEHEHWLFLEYVDGLSVGEASRRKPLHMKHTVDWSLGVARGMDLMHSRFKLIHRDLKPANVLIDKDGLIPKISDMGIAKVLQEDEGENTIIGTRGYRAPETWAGRTDFVSDIYSFGATMYAMLTGGAPKGRDNPLQSGRQLAAPSSLNDRVPPELDAITLKCLEEDPRNRYQSFAEIIPLLESLPTFTGDVFDAGYHYCKDHKYYSLIRDGKEVCDFCEQTTFSEQQLEKAQTGEATVRADAPVVEHTQRIPDSVRPSGAEYTQTAPTHMKDGAAVPRTIAAPPIDPTLSAPGGAPAGSMASSTVTAPSDSETEPRSKVMPILAVVILIAIAAVVWPMIKGGADPTENGGKRIVDSSGEIGPLVKKTAETGDLTNCADPNCLFDGERRKFEADNSATVDDHPGQLQSFCKAARHVACARCGLRHISAASWMSKGGFCSGCRNQKFVKLDGKDQVDK